MDRIDGFGASEIVRAVPFMQYVRKNIQAFEYMIR